MAGNSLASGVKDRYLCVKSESITGAKEQVNTSGAQGINCQHSLCTDLGGWRNVKNYEEPAN
jgi:hypothetical protein